MRDSMIVDLPVAALDPASDPALAGALVARQRAAYRVEAALIGAPAIGPSAIPPLADTPSTLVAAGLSWLAVTDADGLAGALGYSGDAALVDVERLVVAPRAFRRGIGAALVAAVLDRAGGRTVVVATGRDNAPARALCTRAGFVTTGEREVAPGLWVVCLRWPGRPIRRGSASPGSS